MADAHSHAHAATATGGQTADIYPAGASYSHGHHGHTIVPMRILLVILGTLLFFTFLTVGAAQIEIWIASTFDIVIPQWVNVTVALSIAAVKSILVVMYFMQLRYDNPLNSIVAIFTVMTVLFFLMFVMIDLGSRKFIYAYKGEQIVAGGIGNIPNSNFTVAGVSPAMTARAMAEAEVQKAIADNRPLNKMLGQFAVEQLARAEAALKPGEKLPEWLETFKKDQPRFAAAYLAYAAKKGHAHGHDDHAEESGPNSAVRSRARTGITLPELGAQSEHSPAAH
jgi:cytochrome c oxidase subunit 4